ncbi:hypothetical protein PanWU01x14_302410 [Parasponia andersonii]|uniref:Uncharacterized protein n=1 Tax=Parasponia andersonii TaxID=3476 RepID=A0A2P5ATE4_PARAD|nr:hypothetical protein PanWU01x14_302410 [Parasponia andersonii]
MTVMMMMTTARPLDGSDLTRECGNLQTGDLTAPLCRSDIIWELGLERKPKTGTGDRAVEALRRFC